ncbi:hypothetical protein [Nocardia brevicatena]|uniref:hypothetical protein n=1 Tax=Nocardia brevicatena TaxID=37327 RepID=UPI0012F8CF5F|nr:hypothetical protein [Nocardia brevicatena]
MADVDRILALTRKALDEFEAPQNGIAGLVRQAHRVAVLRHDYSAQVWLSQQLADSQPSEVGKEQLQELRRQLVTLLGEEAGREEYARQCRRYLGERLIEDGDSVDARSIDELEQHLAQIEQFLAGLVIPPNLAPLDAGLRLRDHDMAYERLNPKVTELRTRIGRIRQGVHEYLVKAEAELESGRRESDFFGHVQTRINALLSHYAPEAAANFVGAQERITRGESEDISHALTSCRRMIKSLADALYPATDETITGLDNIPRKMGDDQYRNRLVQYVREKVGKHKNGAVLQAVLTDLGGRLSALDALASKGVHAEASLNEAYTCIAQTYLLAGDLLSIADETSPFLQADAEVTDPPGQ